MRFGAFNNLGCTVFPLLIIFFTLVFLADVCFLFGDDFLEDDAFLLLTSSPLPALPSAKTHLSDLLLHIVLRPLFGLQSESLIHPPPTPPANCIKYFFKTLLPIKPLTFTFLPVSGLTICLNIV